MEKIELLSMTRKLGAEILNSEEFDKMKKLEYEFELDKYNKELEDKYIEAKKEWEELSKNIFQIMEYYIGRDTTKSCSKGCCSKK